MGRGGRFGEGRNPCEGRDPRWRSRVRQEMEAVLSTSVLRLKWSMKITTITNRMRDGPDNFDDPIAGRIQDAVHWLRATLIYRLLTNMQIRGPIRMTASRLPRWPGKGVLKIIEDYSRGKGAEYELLATDKVALWSRKMLAYSLRSGFRLTHLYMDTSRRL